MLQIGKKIIQNDYKIVTIFNELINLFIYFLTQHACVRLCLVFNPLSTVLLRLEVFSAQVGCVYDKLGGSSSEWHIVVSLSKTESAHIQKNIPFPKKRFAVTTPVF